jgi:hypothetical protein
MGVDQSMFDDPWRVRCPEGHVGLRKLDGCKMAYCHSCRRSYGFENLVDAAEGRAWV